MGADSTEPDIGFIFNYLGIPGGQPKLYDARTANTLAHLKDSQGRYLDPSADFAALAKLVTNQISNYLGMGTNESQAFVG